MGPLASSAMDTALAEAREKATLLREWGADVQATAAERAIELIASRYRELLYEPLSLEAAAAESGYSADHLGRLVRDGTIPNAGELYAPRIRRLDLPRRPGHELSVVAGVGDAVPSREQVARTVANSNNGGRDG